ncbi:MAG: hypothetical protein KZQ95_01435 [Candidatus Thiodiazotropha sp. (ex Epidulcina cf. delphinae)]|nr:hypothetical protein [Candidatus Thiodiazotropha sp. (ex Epidulcina cf. delphinae)]
MQKERLSEHLRRYYEEQQPSEKQMEQLLEMVETIPPEATGNNNHSTGSASIVEWLMRVWRGPARPLWLASLFALGLFISASLITNSGDITQLVVQEISLNHNKRLSVEFPVETYAELSQQMNKLDFMLRPSARVDGSRYQLLGGRYCSIQGRLAAQLKFQDEAGEIHTLYQTLHTEALTELEEGRVQQNGLNITLWNEAGLLYGLASPVSLP